GATHQCNEDLATMRVIPGMTVICPADAVEARAAVEAAINHVGPVYMRFGRAATPVLFDKDTYKFEIGKGIVMADGADVTLVGTGMMTAMAIEARELLKADGIDAAVINLPTIKPIDADLLTEYAKKTGCMVTAEEHNIIGGLGSAVCEVLSETCPVPTLRVGVEDKFGASGKAMEMMEVYGLTPANIAEKARRAVKIKNQK
ncbi:MAG: transketolase family protein, partial [Clostridia bacterium]|nr:transketolase family protein [Clostridia bacterium]